MCIPSEASGGVWRPGFLKVCKSAVTTVEETLDIGEETLDAATGVGLVPESLGLGLTVTGDTEPYLAVTGALEPMSAVG